MGKGVFAFLAFWGRRYRIASVYQHHGTIRGLFSVKAGLYSNQKRTYLSPKETQLACRHVLALTL